MNQESDGSRHITSQREQRFIMFIGIAFCAMLLNAFILTLLGIIDLRIAAQVNLPSVVEFAINTALFMVNIFFMFSIILEIFDKRIIKIVVFYLPVYLVCCLFPNAGLIATIVLPTIYLFVWRLVKRPKDFKHFFINVGVFIFTVSTYQQLALLIKLNYFGIQYYKGNCITALLFASDLYLVYILYCLVVIKHVEFNSIFPESKNIREVPERIQDGVDLSGLKAHQRFLFWCMAMGYQVFQLTVVLLIGFINNTIIELLVMLIVFFIGRPILGTSWHSDKLSICSAATFTGFYILTKCTLPISVSLFSCIALSAAFVYLLHKIGVHVDKYETYRTAIEQKPFKVVGATEKDLLERCQLKRVRKENRKFLVEYFIEGISAGEMVLRDESGTKDEMYFRTKAYKLKKRLEAP